MTRFSSYMEMIDPVKMTEEEYDNRKKIAAGTGLEEQPVRIRFTPSQRALLTILSDGQPHTYEELLAGLGNGTALESLKVHLSEIRRTIRFFREEIVCEIHKRKRCYRHIHLLREGRDGVAFWLYQEFISIVTERDEGVCQRCGSRGDCVHHVKSWAKHPKLRLNPANGVLLCYACHDKISRKTGTLGRPKGSVDDPSKRVGA
jgi:5-methylcytosine-specific restriction endonuclease McrA